MFRIIAGNGWADGLKWGATRAVLLAIALATGIFAGAMVNPQTAQAACNVPAFPGTPINVSCGPAGTTTTTVGQFGQGSIYPDPTAVGVWRVYPGTLSAQIDQGATVNGFGLDFVAAPGAALTVTNQGRVTTAEVGRPDSCCAALFMAGNGGPAAILYQGNGSAINTASTEPGLSIVSSLLNLPGNGPIDVRVGTGVFPGPTLLGSVGLLVEHSGSGPIFIQVNNGSAVTGTGSVAPFPVRGDGIFASSTGGSDITVRLEEGATTTTNNPLNFYGIRAETQGGNGSNVITVNGTVIDGGIRSSVVGTGTNTVNVGGSIFASGHAAVDVSSENGANTVNINGNSIVQGIGSVANPVISATSGTGTTTINNSGVILSTNGDAKDLAISSPVTTGQIVINNAGTLLGRISLPDGNNVFNNIGTWTASDGAGPAANFGGGLNTLNNSGTINMASTFAGIETINNGVGGVINAGNIPGAGSAMFTTSKVQTVNNAGTLNVNGTASFIGAPGSTFNNLGTGVINMQNGNTTDRVTTANYVGAPGSRLNVDINLARNNASQRADLLSIGGNSSGTTAINFNVLSNARGFFTTPIPVVQVAPGGATFTVANPSALAPSGLVSYAFQEIAPGDFSVVSHFNAGVGGSLMAGLGASVLSIQNFFEPFNGELSTRNPGSPLLGTFDTRDPNRPVGGMWIRANGGHNQVDSVSTAFLPNGQSPASGISTNTNYAGYQIGFDSGLLNWFDSSWNVHAGVTGGQIFASGAETTGLGKLDLGQNFLGAYAVATRGAFFADVFVRRDWYDAKPALPMIEQNTDFSGRGYGVVATMGYNWRLNNGYFIEPQVGLHLTRANFDTVNLPADQQMAINSVNSTLFRASVRAGKTFDVADRLVAQPFITVSILHEFENQLSEQFFEPVGNVLIPTTTTQVGTFGQYGVGIAASVPGTGTLGFVRFDGRVGENIRGWSLTGGARVSFNSP